MHTQETTCLEPILFKHPDLVRLTSLPTFGPSEGNGIQKRSPEIGIVGQIWDSLIKDGCRLYKFVFKDEGEWRQVYISSARFELVYERALGYRVARVSDIEEIQASMRRELNPAEPA